MLKKVLVRLKNKKVILGVASGILLILVNLGLIDAVQSNELLEVANTILGVGVAIGILSNPDTHTEQTK